MKSVSFLKKQYVVLVDENNKRLGIQEKMHAHIEAKHHRAFSIFVFNNKGELLLQQREISKYHCGGLWSNTVCSHPKPDENFWQATHRRLKEEMGFDCKLKKIFCFNYEVSFDNGITEKEHDCVFIGKYDGDVLPNKKEVMNYKWISPVILKKDILNNPGMYTEWFKIALDRVLIEFSLFL